MMRKIGNPNELPSGAIPPDGPLTRARECALIPNRTTDPEGFIDFGHAIASFAAIREAARIIGMVDEKEVLDIQSAFEDTEAELREEIGELRNRADALQKIEEAREIVAAADAVAA